jgi:hypothetical protein
MRIFELAPRLLLQPRDTQKRANRTSGLVAAAFPNNNRRYKNSPEKIHHEVRNF